jgi:hypothetical protein
MWIAFSLKLSSLYVTPVGCRESYTTITSHSQIILISCKQFKFLELGTCVGMILLRQCFQFFVVFNTRLILTPQSIIRFSRQKDSNYLS